MVGVIDIGSNTIRLLIYRVTETGKLRSVISKKYMTGLAGDVDRDGALTETGTEKAIAALTELKTFLSAVKVEALYVFATASLRNIINTEEVVSRITAATGFEVDVLSGEREARYGYYGLIQEYAAVSGLSVDVGGGSTEISFFADGKVEGACSLPVGSLNRYTRYVSKILPKKKEMRRIRKDVDKRLEAVPMPQGVSPVLLFCEGGTARAAQKVLKAVGGETMDKESYARKDLKKFLHAYAADKKQYAKILLKTVPERIHTIIPGMIIIDTIASHYGVKRLITAAGGVREGYLWCKLNGVDPLADASAAS